MARLSIATHYLPMDRILLVAFSGVQTLDVAGPAEVFATAERQRGTPTYAVILASLAGGTVRTTCGFALETRALEGLRPRPRDTVLVAGGEEVGVRAAVGDTKLVAWIARAARVVRRIGSVCSGAFVLARAGLLDGRRAATHWSSCAQLAAYRPAVDVDRNAIFVRDGHVWTSAGVTTGIDMALAMVEEDFDRSLADRVAARLVLYARRPGFQSQFTEALLAQTQSGDPFGAIVAQARAELRSLDVSRLAKLAGLSGRTLHRRCHDHLGITPAKLVERLRVEHARTLLSTTSRPLKTIAHESGFATSERMGRAFERELGVRPREVRLLFGREARGTQSRMGAPLAPEP
jgi:transcriptional regulator GlxA family with amidase domain